MGPSLAIIALNAVGGLIGQFQQVSINWSLTFAFLGLALVGMFGGMFVAQKVPSESLSKAFGWFVVVLALVIGGLAATGKLDMFSSSSMTSQVVAKAGYQGYRDNKDVVIPGWKNRLMVTGGGFLPRFATRKLVTKMQDA